MNAAATERWAGAAQPAHTRLALLLQHPMLLALGLLLGSALPYLSSTPLAWSLPPLLVSALALLWHAQTRCLALLLLGLLLSEHSIRAGMERRPAQTSVLELQGTISELPEQFERAQRFMLRVTASHPPSPVRQVRLSWYGDNPTLNAGQSVTLQAKIRRPRSELNPGGFDFERHALANRIDAVGYVTRLSQSQPAKAWQLNRIRTRISHWWRDTLGDTPASQLLRALVVGDTQALTDAAWSQFRRTGTTHLIAISGLHITGVAWIAALLAGALTRLWPPILRRYPRPIIKAWAGLAAASAYVLIAGFGVPAQRTLIGLSVFLTAILLRRETSAWQALGWAAIAVLLYDPFALLSSGFWLSFGAVGAILWLDAGRRIRGPHWRTFFAMQWRLSLFLVPLGLWWFQQLSLVGPLTNLWAVPWISFFTVPLALLATALAWVPWLGTGLAHLAELAALVFLYGTEQAASWSWVEIKVAAPSPEALAVALCGLLWLNAPRGWPMRWAGAPLLLVLLPAAPDRPLPGDFRLHVFDVGQGLSVLIRTQQHDLLYDTGPGLDDAPATAERTVLPAMRSLGVQALERLIISHNDMDHAGGLSAVQAAFPAPLDSSAPLPHARPCLLGERFELDGVRFEYLHPNAGLPYLRNESSCVLRIAGARGAALLPGDIGHAIEERLVARQSDALKAAVLIAPHHGSAGSSGQSFVNAVAPALVIYASGYQDRFDFPKPEVSARYARLGAQQFETGTSGALDIRFSESGRPQVRAWRAQQARRWRE